MFGKRKKIVIGETYIFDVLNESNMAVTTSIVTVVKKGKKRKNWIVLSVNNGDVFECSEELLTPYVNYNDIIPIVRCHYGVTEFDYVDVKYFDFVDVVLECCIEMLPIDVSDEAAYRRAELIEKMGSLRQHTTLLKNKVGKYYEISNYKHNLKLICNIAKAVKEEAQKHVFKPTTSNKEVRGNMEVDSDDSKVLANKINNSRFYEEFDEAVKRYMTDPEWSMEEFVDKALDILEDSFPEDAMIPVDERNLIITEHDIECLKRAAARSIGHGNIVFLVGMTKGEKVALAVYHMDDFDRIDEYVSIVYDGWYPNMNSDKYRCEHRIVMLSVPKNKAIGDDRYE